MPFANLILGMVLFSFACTCAGSTEYEVKTTFRGMSALFNLPRNDQVFFGYRMNTSTASYRLNLFADGIRLYYEPGNMTLLGQEWRIFWITRKEIIGPTLHTTIPKQHRILRGRSLQISSRETIEWQMFTLPRNDSLRTTSEWNESTFHLPEKEIVFIGLRQKEHGVSQFHLYYFDVSNSVGQNFTALPWEGWTFIRISRYVVYPKVASGHLDIPNPSPNLQGRKIIVSSKDQVQWQMFALPLQYENSLTTEKHDSIRDEDSTEQYSLSTVAVMAILCGVMLVIATILRGYIGYLKRHGSVNKKDIKDREIRRQ
ncbi:uncharacterized protein [Palaemon carinicauda]|uniref:uncharacterized protein n=1 Tax=Palaemon carinicauda TaxID=392227 RepID=UPI0035B653C3